MKKIFILFSAFLIVACAAYKPMVPKQGDADRAAMHYPGTTLEDLQHGKTIFEASCHKCHSLKKPFNKTPEEIKAALPVMAKRAKLDSHQEELVLHYLLTMNPTSTTK